MTTLAARLRTYLELTRFNRPIGTLLLLWPTLWALWLAAGGWPSTKLLCIFVLGAWLTRSAGCVINDLADRKLDGAVERTRARPLVTGAVTPGAALALAAALGLVAFTLVLFTNSLTVLLSVAGPVLAAGYPFMKRHSHLPQLVLGIAFSWGIPMAFAAVLNELPPLLWLIFVANLLWIIAYDTEYAMVDRPDDLKAGIKSTAILFGRMDRAAIGALHALTLLALILVGLCFALSVYYYLSLAAVAALFAYQHKLISRRQPAHCFRAFLHNNYVGAAVFAGIFLHFWLAAPNGH